MTSSHKSSSTIKLNTDSDYLCLCAIVPLATSTSSWTSATRCLAFLANLQGFLTIAQRLFLRNRSSCAKLLLPVVSASAQVARGQRRTESGAYKGKIGSTTLSGRSQSQENNDTVYIRAYVLSTEVSQVQIQRRRAN